MSLFAIVKELGNKLILPSCDTELYEEKRQNLNLGINLKPAAFVLCENEQDVITAVRLAKKINWSVPVNNGGHLLAGIAVGEEKLVLDLSNMKDIRINAAPKTVEVASGVKSGELSAEIQKFNLAVPIGLVSNTCIFDVALGRRRGYLHEVHDCYDNIIGATIVNADGKILEVNETSHPDLFWEIRGVDWNCGIITKLVFQAYEIDHKVFALDMLNGFDEAKQVLPNM